MANNVQVKCSLHPREHNDYSFIIHQIKVPMARPSRKTEIQEKIFNAAFELMANGGLQQSPMSKLAAQAQVSVGTIYLYFPSKERLIEALFEHLQTEMEQAVLLGYRADADFRARFKKLFLNMCDYYYNHRNHFFFMDMTISSVASHGLEAFSPKVQKVFRSFYEEGIKNQILRDINFENLLSIIHGPIVSIFKKHHNGRIKITTDNLVELQECIWNAIRF